MNFGKLFLILFAGLMFFGCINLDTGDTGQQNNNEDNGNVITNATVIIGDGQGGIVGTNTTNNSEDENNEPFNPDSSASLSIYFINTNYEKTQGDAILFKKGEYEMLIDAGPSETSAEVINFLKGKVQGDIEVLVLTHEDMNHWGAVPAIAQQFEIDSVWWNGKSVNADYKQLVQDLEDNGAEIIEVVRGQTYDTNGAEMLILNPPKPAYTGIDTSAVAMHLSFENFCMLFFSDTVYGSQADIMNTYTQEIKCPVMQVPYSGLGTGNTQLNLLLKFVEPKAAIITGSSKIDVSDPSNQRTPTYQQLVWEGIDIYTTYPESNELYTSSGGNVKVSSDGFSYIVTYI